MGVGEILAPPELTPLSDGQVLIIVRKYEDVDSGPKHPTYDQTYDALLLDAETSIQSVQGQVYEKKSEANKLGELHQITTATGTEAGVSGKEWTFIAGGSATESGEDGKTLNTLALTQV